MTENTLQVAPLKHFTDELFSTVPNGSRYLFSTLTFRVDEAFMNELYSLSEAILGPLSTECDKFALVFQPWPQIMTSKSKDTGGNVLGISAEDGNLINMAFYAVWESPEEDNNMRAVSKQLIVQASAKAKEMGVYSSFMCMNSADEWQDPIRGYGVENVEFLQDVSRKYDPKGIFQTALKGGFKLNRGKDVA